MIAAGFPIMLAWVMVSFRAGSLRVRVYLRFEVGFRNERVSRQLGTKQYLLGKPNHIQQRLPQQVAIRTSLGFLDPRL